MIEIQDSYFNYVADRILTINPARVIGGVVDAESWPLAEVTSEAFYLLVLQSNQAIGPGDQMSQSQPLIGVNMQWVWIVLGDALASGQVGTNRGDKGRINATMHDELRQAHFPGFCEKKAYSIVNNTLTATAYTPPQQIWWSSLRYPDKLDQKSGVIYGAAASVVYGFSKLITD
jgi:hypothetical protein